MWQVSNRRLIVCGLAAVCAAALGCVQGAGGTRQRSETYVAVSPELAVERTDVLNPVIRALQDRLDRAKRWCGLADLGPIVSGPAGPGFLRQNPKGLSLPYVAVIDLGTAGPAEPNQLAGSIAGRIRAYMQALNRVNCNMANRPVLSFLDDRAVDSQPSVADVALVAEALTKRLAQVQMSAGTVAYFTDSQKRRLPYLLRPNEAVIPVHTCVRFVSNGVRFERGAFAGIRIVTLEVLFNARVWFPGTPKPMPVNILPSRTRPAGPAFCDPLPLELVCTGGNQADALHHYAIGAGRGRSLHALRERLGLQWVQEAFDALARKDVRTALLRYHAGCDALAPLFSSHQRQLIAGSLRRWLRDDSAVLAEDVRQQLDDWQILARRRDLFSIYVNSGAWSRLVAFVEEAAGCVDRALTRHPDNALVHLAWNTASVGQYGDFRYVHTEHLTRMDADAQAQLWTALVDTLLQVNDSVTVASANRGTFVAALRKASGYAEQLSAKTGPSEHDLAELSRLFRQRLARVGYRLVPLYEGTAGEVGVLRQDADVARLDPDHAAYWRWPAPIAAELPVFDAPPRGQTPLRVVGVCIPDTPDRRAAHEAFLARLRDDGSRYRW